MNDNINWARVFGGGLLAGLIINIGEFILNEPLMGAELAEIFASMNREPPGSGAIMIFVMMGFAVGIFTVWLYTAIRPRFGPGAKTAGCAGLIVWGLGWLSPNVNFAVLGIYPLKVLVIATGWALMEITLGAVVGAWLYKEPESPVS